MRKRRGGEDKREEERWGERRRVEMVGQGRAGKERREDREVGRKVE